METLVFFYESSCIRFLIGVVVVGYVRVLERNIQSYQNHYECYIPNNNHKMKSIVGNCIISDYDHFHIIESSNYRCSAIKFQNRIFSQNIYQKFHTILYYSVIYSWKTYMLVLLVFSTTIFGCTSNSVIHTHTHLYICSMYNSQFTMLGYSDTLLLSHKHFQRGRTMLQT